MILSVRMNNFLVYAKGAEFSLIGDARIKKFDSNVYCENGFRVLKSACIYGANNVGKTCVLRAINSIRNVMLGMVAEVPTNLFSGSNICSLGISFLHDGKAYSYDFKFDLTTTNNLKRGFVYERFAELVSVKGNVTEKELFVRDTVSGRFFFDGNEQLGAILKAISCNNILVYTLSADSFPEIKRYYDLFRAFADKICVLTLGNIPIENTIRVLKENKEIRDKTVELIKLADLDIEDFKYMREAPLNTDKNADKPQELVLHSQNEDLSKLTSIHNGKSVQSFIFDSTGTKKMVALASYIVEALSSNRILVVDELDSSLHFKLTRAIVSLFNNELSNAQLIFTAHDINLLDCKKLFRKDQIWFAAKDKSGATLYPLSNFTEAENNDLISQYKMGEFGALPKPDLIELLLGDRDE